MIIVRKSLSHLFGQARDQGQRPTCLPFAASDGHAACRDIWEDLSVEYLCHFAGDVSAGFTKGVRLSDALTALRVHGQPVESDYPYESSGARSDPPEFPPGRVFRCTGLETSPTLNDVVDPIERDRPVLIVMSISDAFYVPGADAHIASNEPEDPSRVHAVVATAYGQKSGATCVQIRNSWGESWGDSGYAWLDAEYLKLRLYQTAVLEIGVGHGNIAA